MDFGQLLAALIPLAFIIHWVVDLLKDGTNKNVNGVATKLVAFIGAYAVIALFAHSSLDLGGTDLLTDLSWSDTALLALAVAAGGGTLAEGFRTFNASDSDVQDKLFPKPPTEPS